MTGDSISSLGHSDEEMVLFVLQQAAKNRIPLQSTDAMMTFLEDRVGKAVFSKLGKLGYSETREFHKTYLTMFQRLQHPSENVAGRPAQSLPIIGLPPTPAGSTYQDYPARDGSPGASSSSSHGRTVDIRAWPPGDEEGTRMLRARLDDGARSVIEEDSARIFNASPERALPGRIQLRWEIAGRPGSPPKSTLTWFEVGPVHHGCSIILGTDARRRGHDCEGASELGLDDDDDVFQGPNSEVRAVQDLINSAQQQRQLPEIELEIVRKMLDAHSTMLNVTGAALQSSRNKRSGQPPDLPESKRAKP